MKNLMGKKFGLLVLAMALIATSAPAFAQVYYACSTWSNGMTFQDSEYDRTTAINRVLSDCQGNPNSIASECTQYLNCQTQDDGQGGGGGGGETPTGWACETQSNGRKFNIAGRGTYSEMVAKVVYACNIAAPYTNPYECQANAYCHQ